MIKKLCHLRPWRENVLSLCLRARRPIRPALISGFRSMKRLGVFLLPPVRDASSSQGYPQHFAGTHLYSWVERGTMRVKCLAQEHNAMSPARTRTWTTRSAVEHTNHKATAPPTENLQAALLLFKLSERFVDAGSVDNFIAEQVNKANLQKNTTRYNLSASLEKFFFFFFF